MRVFRLVLLSLCALCACSRLHPSSLHEALQIVVQRVNEQDLLGEQQSLDAQVAGDTATLIVRERGHAVRVLRLVSAQTDVGMKLGKWVIVWPPGVEVPPDVRIIAALVERVLTREFHVVYSAQEAAFSRALVAVVGLLLLVACARGLRTPHD